MIRLRPGRPADAPRIAAVDAATSTAGWSVTSFDAELVRDDRCYVVAVAAPGGRDRVADGEVVGYGGLALLADDGHLLGLAVRAERRRQGIARRLLTALLDAAAHSGVDDVTLEVRPSNAPARALYRAVGFATAGRRPGYYPDGEDALILWRHGGSHATATSATTVQRDGEGA